MIYFMIIPPCILCLLYFFHNIVIPLSSARCGRSVQQALRRKGSHRRYPLRSRVSAIYQTISPDRFRRLELPRRFCPAYFTGQNPSRGISPAAFPGQARPADAALRHRSPDHRKIFPTGRCRSFHPAVSRIFRQKTDRHKPRPRPKTG